MTQTNAKTLSRARSIVAVALLAAASAVLAVSTGCGGGGGGGGPSATSPAGRSYTFKSGGNVFDISIDSTGRFTIFVASTSTDPAGAGGQASLSNTNHFSVTTTDGKITVTGQTSTDASTATGSVQAAGGATLFTFTANVVAAGAATPATAAGTISNSVTNGSVYLTADASSHFTIWATIGATPGGGTATVPAAAGGAFQTTDGSTAGTWAYSSSGGAITFTKLGGKTVSQTFTFTKATKAAWTVLVYLNAANNLRDFGPFNFNQMEEVGSNSNVNIVVQWKQAQCSDCGTSDWYSTRRYLVTKNNDFNNSGGNGTDIVGSTLVQDLGANVDMGSFSTLNQFIAWGQQNYPANHYALFIWDHGAGWFAASEFGYRAKAHAASRSLSFDDATMDAIDVWQLPQALTATPQMDLVAFDCSLMQMTEVDYQIRNNTSVIVGSEESPPGFGYPYNLFLADLEANPTWTAKQLGADIVTQTLAYYTQNPGQNPNQDNTQSAVDATKMAALATSINTLGNVLLANEPTDAAALAQARNSAEDYDPNAGYMDFKDLYDYCTKIQGTSAPGAVKTAAANVQAALTNAVILNMHGPNHPQSHGLSIYVPANSSSDPYDTLYSNLAFAQDTSWPRWLQGQTQ